jgi:hypothetical protein
MLRISLNSACSLHSPLAVCLLANPGELVGHGSRGRSLSFVQSIALLLELVDHLPGV